MRFPDIVADLSFLYQAKKKDPVGSRKSPEKEEGLSGAQSHRGKAGTFGKERGKCGDPGGWNWDLQLLIFIRHGLNWIWYPIPISPIVPDIWFMSSLSKYLSNTYSGQNTGIICSGKHGMKACTIWVHTKWFERLDVSLGGKKILTSFFQMCNLLNGLR